MPGTIAVGMNLGKKCVFFYRIPKFSSLRLANGALECKGVVSSANNCPIAPVFASLPTLYSLQLLQ